MAQHSVQLYRRDDFLVQRVSEFVQGTPGPAVIIATQPHVESLKRRMGARPHVHYHDAHATLASLLVDGRPDRDRFLQVIGQAVAVARGAEGEPVLAFGEMVAILWMEGKRREAIELEGLWNEFCAPNRVTLLCAYPMASFEDAAETKAFLEVCHAHDLTAPAEDFPAADEAQQQYVARLQQQAGALAAEVERRARLQRELDRREREFADFCENAVEALHQVGPDGTILWANQAELDLLGYAREEYVGQPIARFHMDQDAIEDILARLSAGEAVVNRAARLRHKDGSVRHVLISSNTRRQDDKVAYTRCFTRDVTDAIRLEQERRRRFEEMANAERNKDRFLAILAHELRNPLVPITGAIELLEGAADPEEGRRVAAMLRRQTGQIARIVDDLLDMARIRQGNLKVQTQEVDLEAVLRQAFETAQPYAAQRGCTLARQPADGLTMQGDHARLVQAVTNLLHNACKYTPPGGLVTLAARREGGELVVAVQDTGSGMEATAIPTLFQAYSQSPTGGRNDGLGLGLFVVRGIVEAHGGTVEARSAGRGQGSEFVMRLPILPATAGASATQEGLAPVARRSILVVDDSGDTVETLARLLRNAGHEVRTATSGPGALAEAARQAPDLVLLDLAMPGMNGYEVAQRLRQSGCGSMLVALSGFTQAADIQRSRDAGFDHHFAKPPRLRDLLDLAACAPARSLDATGLAPRP